MDSLQILAHYLLETSQTVKSITLQFSNNILISVEELPKSVNYEEVHNLLLALGYGQVKEKDTVKVFF